MGVGVPAISKQQDQEHDPTIQKEHSMIEEDVHSVAASDNNNSEPLVSQSLTLTIEDSGSTLSSGFTNTPEENDVPRSIIASSLSKSSFKAELLRPLISGKFNGEDSYYLLKLRFEFHAADGGFNWLSRIRRSRIEVVLKDAPLESATTRPRRKKPEGPNPSIIKVYPDCAWEGPISNTLGVNGTSPGTAKVTTMRTGRPQCNILVVTVMEHPDDASGIPTSLIVPIIVCHHKRRFSMQVTVNATFGFWCGPLASSVPILGGADEPLYFNPEVLEQKQLDGSKDIAGVSLVKGSNAMDEIDLQGLSSLDSNLPSRSAHSGVLYANW
jgi:hypothetical protein